MEITDIRHTIYEPQPLRQAIRGILLNALAYTSGNARQASKLLGISPRVMCYNMKAYDIPNAGGHTKGGGRKIYLHERG